MIKKQLEMKIAQIFGLISYEPLVQDLTRTLFLELATH
jgi:hypothetical protein